MLGKIKKQRKMESFKIQALRSIVKEGGDDIIERFEKKFMDIKVEGNRKSVAGVNYTELEQVHPDVPEVQDITYT